MAFVEYTQNDFMLSEKPREHSGFLRGVVQNRVFRILGMTGTLLMLTGDGGVGKRVATPKIAPIQLISEEKEMIGQKDLFSCYLFGIDEQKSSPRRMISQQVEDLDTYLIGESIENSGARDTIESLWRYKISKSPKTLIKKHYQENVVPYINGTKAIHRSDLGVFRGNIDEQIHGLQSVFHWEKARERIPSYASDFFEQVGRDITAEDLLAYGMTELLPGEDGYANLHRLNVLLKCMGEEYVLDLIPALYDTQVSWGLWQFVERYSFGTEENPGGVRVMNTCLPEEIRVSGSLLELQGMDQAKSAFLMSLYNLQLLCKKLPKSDIQKLHSYYQNHQELARKNLIQYIAAAHHNPSLALEKMQVFIKNNFQGQYYEVAKGIKKHEIQHKSEKKKKPHQKKKTPEVGIYAEKTLKNRNALLSSFAINDKKQGRHTTKRS